MVVLASTGVCKNDLVCLSKKEYYHCCFHCSYCYHDIDYNYDYDYDYYCYQRHSSINNKVSLPPRITRSLCYGFASFSI